MTVPLEEAPANYVPAAAVIRNEPANVVNACKKIAEIQNIDLDIVDKVTTNNARKVFNI